MFSAPPIPSDPRNSCPRMAREHFYRARQGRLQGKISGVCRSTSSEDLECVFDTTPAPCDCRGAPTRCCCCHRARRNLGVHFYTNRATTYGPAVAWARPSNPDRGRQAAGVPRPASPAAAGWCLRGAWRRAGGLRLWGLVLPALPAIVAPGRSWGEFSGAARLRGRKREAAAEGKAASGGARAGWKAVVPWPWAGARRTLRVLPRSGRRSSPRCATGVP